jgi:hypothetical protein
MRWWRRLVIPVVVLAVIIVSSTRVISSHDAGLVHFTWCFTEQLSNGEPASDVLIVGSSRSGLGVDPPWIEEQLLAGDLTVERTTFGTNGELIKDLGLRTYLRDRGVPKTLVLELGFEQHSAAFEAIHGPSPEPFSVDPELPLAFSGSTYNELISDLVSHGDIGLADVLLRSTVVSPARFAADRLDDGVAVALRHPGSVVERKTADCPPNIKVQSANWTWGTSRPYQPKRIKEPDPAVTKQLELAASTFRGVEFDDPFTQDELTLTRDIIRTARQAGVENVILLYLPSYGKAGAAVNVDQIRTLFPDEPIIDGYRVMHDPSKPLLQYQYHDVTHVNRIGARAISQAIVDAVNALDLG